MAAQNIPLTYKGHPLRRKDSLIYYGSMAQKIYHHAPDSLPEEGSGPGRGDQGFRSASAHRPGSEEPGPGG